MSVTLFTASALTVPVMARYAHTASTMMVTIVLTLIRFAIFLIIRSSLFVYDGQRLQPFHEAVCVAVSAQCLVYLVPVVKPAELVQLDLAV